MINNTGNNLIKDPFTVVLKFARDIDLEITKFGHEFFNILLHKLKVDKLTVQQFDLTIKSIFPEDKIEITLKKNLFVFHFDLEHDGFINEKEAGLLIRNLIVAFAGDVAFNDDYLLNMPSSEYKNDLEKLIIKTAEKYLEVKDIVFELLDRLDMKKQGKISINEFLDSFSYPKNSAVLKVIEHYSNDEGESFSKARAFYLLCHIVLTYNETTDSAQGVRIVYK